jgi:uncharacterized membrane protein YqiK
MGIVTPILFLLLGLVVLVVLIVILVLVLVAIRRRITKKPPNSTNEETGYVDPREEAGKRIEADEPYSDEPE